MTKARSNATAPAAKGEIVVGTGTDVSGILGVGNSGDTLVADSSQTTGLRYNPPVGSLANPVINGGFDIWQRGTSFTVTSAATNVLTADRWQAYRGATGMTVTRQTTSDTTNLPNVQFALRAARDSGNTSTTDFYIFQNMETTNSIPFAGKTVTVSFYARRGANYSATSNLLTFGLRTGTGTDQNWITGYTGDSGPTGLGGTVTLTTTWQRFTFTGTIFSTATEIAYLFYASPTGTAGANDWFEITGVQMDVGTWTASTAPTFRRSGGTLAGELAACRRYLPAFPGANFLEYIGYAYGTNTSIFVLPFDVPARVAPTGITVSGTIAAFAQNTSTTVTPTFNAAGTTAASILASHTITSGQGARIQIQSGALVLFTGCEL